MLQDEIEQPLSLSMDPYTGTWTKATAAHLLKRTLFGPTNQQILDAVGAGMNATVASLLQIPAIGVPLAYDPAETVVPMGTTWVNAVYPSNATAAAATQNARLKSLGAWMVERVNTENDTIAEKICLFWHNHFGVSYTSDPRANYNYLMLLRQHALGDIKQLIKDVTIDPAMLIFLNGGSNNLYSPNENYARELLELFTIGKGPQIGPGDYTNYTEDDVAAGAKILTGYLVQGLLSDTETTTSSIFTSLLHDSSNKQLSAHFGNAVINNNGADEYSDYIDIIFQQAAVANYLSTKLYRYFVNYDITSTVQTDVISVMAQTMIDNNYMVLPVLDQLFKSQHFYDVAMKGAIIRGPLEMMMGMLNATSSAPNFDLATNSDMYLAMYWYSQTMGQELGLPPSVAGWPAYYQAPAFSKLWLNSTTIKTRFDISTYITVFTGLPVNGENFKINLLGFLNALSVPSNATVVIDDMVDVFFPKGATVGDKFVLKNILHGGLGDAEWQLQYNNYIADSGNTTLSDPIALRVGLVLNTLFKMPQFQTI
ncbi:MAG: DUF1800 family protein [Bacteroidota bacterium]